MPKNCVSKPIIITFSAPGILYIVQAIKQAPVSSKQMSLCIKESKFGCLRQKTYLVQHTAS